MNPIPTDATEVAFVTPYRTTIRKVDRHTPAYVYVLGRKYSRKTGFPVPLGTTGHIEVATPEHQRLHEAEELASKLDHLTTRIDRLNLHARRRLRSNPFEHPAIDLNHARGAITALRNATIALERAVHHQSTEPEDE